MSAHCGWRVRSSRGIAPRKVSTFLPGARAEGDAVSDGCGLQRPQRARFLTFGIDDLDAETLELLEELLVSYEGTLLLVSHDRAFLDNVVTGTIVHEGKGCFTEYTGGYEDWLRQRKVAEAAKIAAPPQPPTPPQKGVKIEKGRKFLNREQRELDELPGKIEELEAKQAELSQRLADPALYQKKDGEFQRVEQELNQLHQTIEKTMARWEELEALKAELSG